MPCSSAFFGLRARGVGGVRVEGGLGIEGFRASGVRVWDLDFRGSIPRTYSKALGSPVQPVSTANWPPEQAENSTLYHTKTTCQASSTGTMEKKMETTTMGLYI